MPKQNINHQNTVIYKIVSKDLNNKDIYIGSTTAFNKRKHQHKKLSNTSNILLYETIRNNGNWDNWDMIEIEKYPCNDKNEATARERYFVELYKANLNNNIPNRTYQEWINDNPGYMKKYFQKTLKAKTKHCACCDKDMKYMSWVNHSRSNQHKANMEKINNIVDDTLPINNDI
jgi:predicted GIY-YIG superfamily endonuclease